jgi:hypothetical protein
MNNARHGLLAALGVYSDRMSVLGANADIRWRGIMAFKGPQMVVVIKALMQGSTTALVGSAIHVNDYT